MSFEQNQFLHQWAVENHVTLRPVGNGMWSAWSQNYDELHLHKLHIVHDKTVYGAIRRLKDKNKRERKEP